MGHASVERILDTWQEEGIENSQEILKVWQKLAIPGRGCRFIF